MGNTDYFAINSHAQEYCSLYKHRFYPITAFGSSSSIMIP